MSIKYILQVLGFAYFFNQQKIDKMFPTAFFSDSIEDVTRWCEDVNFIFEWQNNILRMSAASKILILPLENKIHIFKPPCNVLFII